MISSCGKMAPPVFIFLERDSKPFVIKEAEEILMLSNKSGKCLEEIVYTSILPHFMKYIEDNSLLIYDEASSHISPRIVELLGTKQIDGMRIPNAITSVVSPIDANLKKKLLSSIRCSFANWCMKNFGDVIGQHLFRSRKGGEVSNKQLAYWILKACKKTTQQDIMRSFREVGLGDKGRQKVILEEVIPSYFANKEKPVENTVVKDDQVKEDIEPQDSFCKDLENYDENADDS